MDDREGKIVARGRIRVDARKALDKLREHMLVDPHLYACELARVAVAGGARLLEVTDDESAVTYAFAGTLTAAEAASARDEVLGGDTAELHAVRLLGIAISAALSLRCEVEILTEGTSVRFADPTGAPEITPAETAPGMVRTIVRSVGLGATIGRVLGAGPRRELALLRAAADGGPLAISVDGEPVPRSPGAPFVLRVPLDEETGATLDVLDPSVPVAAEIVFRENGIRLAAYPLDLARMGNGMLPLRVNVDAPRLPTNASRSEVRFDGGLAERVLRRAEAMLDRVVATLDSRVVRGIPVDRSFVVGGDDAAFGRALARFAVVAARARGPNEPRAAGRTNRLLALPLLDDAFGAPLSLARVLGPVRILVHDGASPLPSALAAVIGSGRGVLVWKHGRPAERILDELATVPADDVVAQALVGAERRARAHTHPHGPPRLEDGRVWQLRQTFEIEKGMFAGLEGEIGVARDGALPTARIFVDGRFLEAVALPGVRLPIELAIAWQRRLVPTLAYDAIERNDALSVAIEQTVRVAALAIAEHANDDLELVRLATAAWAAAARALGHDTADTTKLPAFVDSPVWPLATGGTTSLGDLDRYASAHGGFVCTAPASTGAAIDGRPVLHQAYAQLVGEILANVRLVPYGRFLGRVRAGFAPSEPLSVHVVRPAIDGWLLRGRRRRRMFHAGIALGETELSKVRHDLDLVYEDDAAIPKEDGQGAHWSTPLWLTGEEAELERLTAEKRRGKERPLAPVAPLAPVLPDIEAKLALFRRISASPAFLDAGEGAALFLAIHAEAPFRAEAALGNVIWRTVQGPTTELHFGAPRVLFATHPAWSWPPTETWLHPVVLLPEGEPGVRLQAVLRAVAVELVDMTAELDEWAVSQRRPPPLRIATDPSQPIEIVPPPAPFEAPTEEEPSFLDSLVRHARALFEPKPEALGTSPLTQALAAALSGLALTGRPVASVVESTRGRPLRYEPGNRRVVVNVRHRSIERLVDDPERLTHLLLAATSEINRELVAVTDAEEIAVLGALLRANADR